MKRYHSQNTACFSMYVPSSQAIGLSGFLDFLTHQDYLEIPYVAVYVIVVASNIVDSSEGY